MDEDTKYENLKKLIRGLGRVLVCYSGGVDSTFLLKAAVDAVGRENVLGLVARSETYPEQECSAALALGEELGVQCVAVETEEMDDRRYVENSKARCYHCKRHLFGLAVDIARERGIPSVLEGSNVDDQGDYRPGRKAGVEAGVVSPLLQSGYTKADIRQMSKKLGLPTHNKPSMACLASRIPYGTPITKDVLRRIEESENFLKSRGMSQVRVRYHGQIARIEVGEDDFDKVTAARDEIAERLQRIGFLYVTLDLRGYRTGSMNEGLTVIPDM